MVKKLAPKPEGTGIVYINGPSGIGKKQILKQARALPVKEYEVCKSLGIGRLCELKQQMQPTLDGGTLDGRRQSLD